MPAQLDLSLLANITDPDLRASLQRLGNAMAEAPSEPKPAPDPSSTAKVIQFPLFPEATRPVSNDMARSALFSCVQGKDRRYIEDALLASQDGIEVRFTGKQLNQDDHDLLMQLVCMAQGKDRSINYCRMLRNGTIVPFWQQIIEYDSQVLLHLVRGIASRFIMAANHVHRR